MYGNNYGYRSGLNKSMINHLKNKVQYLTSLNRLKENSVVLDIGSNDGTLLSFYDENLIKIGIDPTIKKYGSYYKQDIIKVNDFFNAEIF